MQVTINGKDYRIPVSLMEITLAERIEFDDKYGRSLKEQLQKIVEAKDSIEREMDFTSYHCELAIKTLSFFGKIPIDVLENTKIDEVLAVYHSTMKAMSEDTDFMNQEFELVREFEWNGETWVIAPPELNHQSVMTFGEFLDAKQWIKNLWEMGQEKWSALLMLACVYFRKEGEKYSKQLAFEGGERHNLLKTLPLEYGMHVAFFLSASMASFQKTFPSLGLTETTAVQN